MIEKALWFRNICLENGLEVDSNALRLLSDYVTLLLEWNKKLNLISRKDEENLWESHIVHCASLVLMVEFPMNSRVLDLGTGGGLPGIVLKILRPDLTLLLLDSTKKKIDAVQQILHTLQLPTILSKWGRAEELAQDAEMKGTYDFVVARAVTELPQLVKWATPFLTRFSKKQESTILSKSKIIPNPPAIVALKGGDISQEIATTQSKYPTAEIQEVPIQLIGVESFRENQKKIVYVHFQ